MKLFSPWFISILVFLLVQLIQPADGKVVTGAVNLTSRGAAKWQYLNKFGFDVGSGSYSIRLKVVGSKRYPEPNVNLQAQIFLDDKWESVRSIKNSCDRRPLSNVNRNVEVPYNEWSRKIEGRLSQRIKPHVWFFSVNRCDLPEDIGTIKVVYEITTMQEDGSHYSIEHRGSLFWTFTQILVIGCLGIYIFKKEREQLKSEGKIHIVVQVFNIVLVVQLLASFIKLVHWWIYSMNGIGLSSLDVLGGFFNESAQAVLTCLIMLIGMGFTITVGQLRALKIQAKVILGVVTLINIILFLVGKWGQDDRYNYSEMEGITGILLAALRGLLVVWHIVAMTRTIKRAQPKQQVFLRRFLLASTVYLAVFPVCYLFAETFAYPFSRVRIVNTVGYIAQFIVLAWLTSLFTSKGEYFQVSTLSDSFLPGAFVDQVMNINWGSSPVNFGTPQNNNNSSNNNNFIGHHHK